MRGRRLVALGIVVCAACGGEGAGGDAAPETAASWDLELLHEIGSIDEPDDALTDVGEVRLHPDGALFIEQPDDENIRMYAPDATFMGTIGTRGEGPEEIARLATFGLHGDTVWVHDARGLAIHRYLRDGTFLERVRWSPEQLPGEGRIRYMLRTNRGMHLYRDGTSLVEPAALVPIEMGAGGEPRPGPDPAGAPGRDDIHVVSYRPAGSVVSTGPKQMRSARSAIPSARASMAGRSARQSAWTVALRRSPSK